MHLGRSVCRFRPCFSVVFTHLFFKFRVRFSCLKTGGRLEGEVECDFAVIEGFLHASLVSREVATVGPSARVYGDVIYNVLELDRVSKGLRP